MCRIISFLLSILSLGISITIYYEYYIKINSIKEIGLYNDICKIYTGGGLSPDKIHWDYNFYYTSSYDKGLYFKHYDCVGICPAEDFKNINCYLNPCHDFFQKLSFYKSNCNSIQKSYDVIFTQKELDKENMYLIISIVLMIFSLIIFIINSKRLKKIENIDPPEYQP